MVDFFYHVTHPTHEDIVTAVFDSIFVGSGVSNVRRLIRDKDVKGFDWRNMCLYLTWNFWSTFVVYPSAGFYLANVVNFCYMLTQLVWLSLLFKYKRSILKVV